MGKTDKKLAVDVAIAYINASGNVKTANGISPGLYDLKQIEGIIMHVYTTLKSLDNR